MEKIINHLQERLEQLNRYLEHQESRKIDLQVELGEIEEHTTHLREEIAQTESTLNKLSGAVVVKFESTSAE